MRNASAVFRCVRHVVLAVCFVLVYQPVMPPLRHGRVAEAQAQGGTEPPDGIPFTAAKLLQDFVASLDQFGDILRRRRAELEDLVAQYATDEAIANCDWNRFSRYLARLPLEDVWDPHLDYMLEKLVELRIRAYDGEGGWGEYSVYSREANVYVRREAERLQARRAALMRELESFRLSIGAQRDKWLHEYLQRCCGKRAPDAAAGPCGGSRDSSWVPPGSTPGTAERPPTGTSSTSGGTGHATGSRPPTDDGTPPPTAGQPPTTGQPPDTGQPPGQPPTSGQPPITGHPPTTGQRSTDVPPVPPQRPMTGDVQPTATFCCESCPGNDRTRFYFPIPPDTDCQPGDVRREDLPYPQCPGNLFTEEPGPPTYGPACCAKKTAQLLYDSAKSGGVKSEVGAALRAACEEDPCAGKVPPKPGTPMRLETSMLSSGTDVHGRNWVPENPVLRLGKERLKPCHAEPFYVTKEATTNAAAAVLSAISTDYEDDAHTAEAAKGASCHASEGGKGAKRDSPQERAAKATALGLLLSQAKGQIEGLRATFDVTGREAALKDAKLQADIVNEVTQRRERLTMPVQFNAGESSQ